MDFYFHAVLDFQCKDVIDVLNGDLVEPTVLFSTFNRIFLDYLRYISVSTLNI